jgi:Na+-translocating ferredoxin:NAD+ oxidoreductase RnfD subunit
MNWKRFKEIWVFILSIVVIFAIITAMIAESVSKKADKKYVDRSDSMVVKTLIDSIMPPLNSINRNFQLKKQ